MVRDLVVQLWYSVWSDGTAVVQYDTSFGSFQNMDSAEDAGLTHEVFDDVTGKLPMFDPGGSRKFILAQLTMAKQY